MLRPESSQSPRGLDRFQPYAASFADRIRRHGFRVAGPALLLGAHAMALQAAHNAVQLGEVARKPNVVVVLADDLGYGDIGSYGVKDIRTPHLDRLAAQGVRLTDAYAAAPVCTPARAALVTGRYPQRSGIEWNFSRFNVGGAKCLASSERSIGHVLKRRGYRTALFGKWHLGSAPECRPRAHGFDEFFGFLGGTLDYYSHELGDGEPGLLENDTPVVREGYLTDLITDRAVRFIDAWHGEPFFAYVAYNAPHFPFQPPGRPDDVRRTKEERLAGTRQDYAAMVESLDAGVGRILAALDRHGLSRDTLVIFASDNGGERLSRNAPLFNGKKTLWEGGIRVPWLMRWPGRIASGTTSRQAAITMDITATILAAAGVDADPGADGIDLLPVLADAESNVERTFAWRIVGHPDRTMKVIRRGRWKYVMDGTAQKVDLLFDVRSDPAERHNLNYRHPDIMNALRSELARWERNLSADGTDAPPHEGGE